MPLTLPPPPSAQEILSLSSAIPANSHTSTSPAKVLSSLVDACNEDWVHNFLFTPDAIELSYLVSPLLPSTAFNCTISQTGVTPPTLLPHPLLSIPCNSRTYGHYLFVPAFHANGTTLGFGAIDGIFQDDDLGEYFRGGNGNERFMTFRFLRDTKKKVLFEVFDYPEDGSVFVFMVKYNTPMTSQGYTAFFLRQPFLRALSDRTKPISVDAIVSSLWAMQENTLYRTCPFCNRAQLPPCSCSPPSFSPAHPFDTGFFTDCMNLGQGEYTGFSKKVFFGLAKEHCPIKIITLGTRLVLEPFSDPSTVVRMGSAAVKMTLLRLGNNPQKSLTSKISVAWPPVECADPSPQLPLTTLASGRHEGAVGAGLAVALSGMNDSGINHSLEHDFLAPISIHEIDANHAPLNDQPVGRTPSHDIVDESSMCDRRSPASTNAISQAQRSLEPSYSLQVTRTVDDSTGPLQTEISDNSTGLSASPKSSGPASNESGANRASSGISLAKGADADIAKRRKKAMERRERNRAAARRSNERAKALRDELLADIRASKEMVEQLRNREVLLRQENLRLRREKEALD